MTDATAETLSDPDRAAASLSTLVRGLSILDALVAAPGPRGLSHATLARQLGFQRSTLYRYLSCLQELGFVEPADETRRYRLGPRALALGAAAIGARGFPRLAKRFVNELADATGETAHATIFDQWQSVTIELADGDGPIGPRIQIGSRRPAHCSASGKTFLAFGPPEALDAYLQRELERRTSGTIADPEPLRTHVDEVRRLGYATDQAEYVAGICCVAAPVLDYRGEPAGALSVSVACERLEPARLAQLTRPLLETAGRFSRELGYDGRRGRETDPA